MMIYSRTLFQSANEIIIVTMSSLTHGQIFWEAMENLMNREVCQFRIQIYNYRLMFISHKHPPWFIDEKFATENFQI